MAWANRDFRSYPARCPNHHRAAISASPEPTLLGAWVDRSVAASEAVMLRQYRFLIRSNPGIDYDLDRLMSSYTFRSAIAQNLLGDWCLYLRAMPSLSTELLNLNPDLAGIV